MTGDDAGPQMWRTGPRPRCHSSWPVGPRQAGQFSAWAAGRVISANRTADAAARLGDMTNLGWERTGSSGIISRGGRVNQPPRPVEFGRRWPMLLFAPDTVPPLHG